MASGPETACSAEIGVLSSGALEGVRLYDELAYLWPIISPPETTQKKPLIGVAPSREKLGDGRHSVLELGVAAGTTFPI